MLVLLLSIQISHAEEIPNGIFSDWKDYIQAQAEKLEEIRVDADKTRTMVSEIYRKEFGEQAFYEKMMEDK